MDQAPPLTSPYKGLMPYSEEDADFFFGRESEEKTITANLRGARLTLLYGPTGVGKSSVLRAGVAHDLRRLARENLGRQQTPELIVVVFNSWRDDIMLSLSERIRDSVRLILKDKTPELRLPAEVKPGTLLTTTLRAWTEQLDSNLLIILDQFEEYFTYRTQGNGFHAFARELARAVNRGAELRVNFLVSIREDSLSKLDLFKSLIPTLFDNYLRIDRLKAGAAYEAIMEPLKVYNEGRAAVEHFSCEPELAREICRQVRTGQVVVGQAGRGLIGSAARKPDEDAEIETPYLQLVLTRLWDEENRRGSRVLRLETLNELGGAEEIIHTHLDQEMNRLSVDEQRYAAQVFHYLVTPGGTKIAHTSSDLAEYVELPEVALSPVLERLSSGDVRILRPVPAAAEAPPVTRYEIFHDVLAPAVLDWRARYSQEQEKSRAVYAERARQRERLDSERKRLKRLIFILCLLALGVIYFVYMYLYSNRLRDAAVRANDEAQAQKSKAEAALSIVDKTDRAAENFKAIMRGHFGRINSVALSPDAQTVATGSNDRTARLWNAATGKSISELRTHSAAVNTVAFSPDGGRVLTASDDGTAIMWNVATGQALFALRGHTGPLSKAVFSPGGKLAATAGSDSTARIWDAGNGNLLRELKGHTGAITDVSFSSGDGRFVVTASIDYTARVWELATGRVVVLNGHENAVNTAAFSPDGNYVVTASEDWTARVWAWRTAKGSILRGHRGGVNTATFNADGTLIATASRDRTAKIWDARTTRKRYDLLGHTDNVLSATFSPDGLRLITASADHIARVWEAQTGQRLFELRGHIDEVTGALISRAGDLAVTASGDTTARVWTLAGAGGVRVTDAALRIEPKTYLGPCPAAIRLVGTITVTGASGTVKYRFVRRGMGPGVEKMITFDSPGTREVSTVYKFGGPSYPHVGGAFFLEVLYPQATSSSDASFNIDCVSPPAGESTPAPTHAPVNK